MSASTLHDPSLFATRHHVASPTPLPDTLIPILSAFVVVVFIAIFFIAFPLPHNLDKDSQSTSFEYYPVGDNYISITARSTRQTAGNTTHFSSVWTFDRTSRTIYSLGQIFRNHTALSELLDTQVTEQILESSFAVDRTNQELITSVDGTERHIKFSDLVLGQK
jgi:hypothetical protein